MRLTGSYSCSLEATGRRDESSSGLVTQHAGCWRAHSSQIIRLRSTVSMRFCSAPVVGLLLVQCCLPLVHAWGRIGHEMVGNLAWRLLSNETQSLVEAYLMHEAGDCPDCSPLGKIADWADSARRTHEYHWSGPLHYIDIHDGSIRGGCPATNDTTTESDCHFVYDRDCVEDVCVVGAVKNYTQRLSIDPTESLKFLTHFVGDLHQPLHVGRDSDRGGNEQHVHYHATYRGTRGLQRHGSNLHSVWDDGIIETWMGKSNRSMLEGMLWDRIQHAIQTGDYDTWTWCGLECISSWAEESLQLALHWAYRNYDGSEVVDGSTLTSDYYRTRLPIVQEQLAVAGARLASLLEKHMSSVLLAQ